MQQRNDCFFDMTTKPPSFRRLFHLNSLGCQGVERRKCIQGYPAGKMYYLFTTADRASTDIPAIKKEHELCNCFSLHRISGIDTIPKFVDSFQILTFFAVAEIAGKANTTKTFGQYMNKEGLNHPRNLCGCC